MRLTIQTRLIRSRSRLPGLALFSLAGVLVALGSGNAQPLRNSAAGTTTCSGLPDNFNCPAEPTTPDAALNNMLVNQYAEADPLCFGFLDFDEFPGQPDCSGPKIPDVSMFMHSMTFAVPSGGFTSATLTFRVKAAPNVQTSSDYIAFFEGATFITGAGFNQLPGSGGTWHANQDVTFSLDLANLPVGFTVGNILQYLNDGDLDIVIGNGTGVDWICLQDCACNCHADPQCDGVTNVLDVVQVVNVAFRGAVDEADPNASCPYTKADVDCSTFINVIDVVRLVNVAFRGGNPSTEFCDPCGP